MTDLSLEAIKKVAPRARDPWDQSLSGNWNEISRIAQLISMQRAVHFLAQTLHESQELTVFEENLRYRSAQRLMEIWPSRFKTIASAAPYVNNPQALANNVYAKRMGNTQAGDGWRFRGRGPIQITGRDMYRTIGKLIGVNIELNPDLVLQPKIGWLVAAGVWVHKNCNPSADKNDLRAVTKKINGGYNGLKDRQRLFVKVKGVFGLEGPVPTVEPKSKGLGTAVGTAVAGGATAAGGAAAAGLDWTGTIVVVVVSAIIAGVVAFLVVRWSKNRDENRDNTSRSSREGPDPRRNASSGGDSSDAPRDRRPRPNGDASTASSRGSEGSSENRPTEP